MRLLVARVAGTLLFALALAGGCAKTGAPIDAPDLAKRDICPDNPALCPGTCCNDACIDTMMDVRNCGGCNMQCPSGSVCSNGHCGCAPTGTPCGAGQSCCGNLGCKSLMSDVNNCGACGVACGAGSTCVGGACKCGANTCATGQVCCNGACANTCASAVDMSMGACVCSSGCPLTHVCVGPDCCVEDALFGSCSFSASCLQSMP